jgi:transcription elongation factor GreA
MLPEPTTAGLMRSLGLDVDGPARWGSPLPSQAPGVFVVETDAPLAGAPIDLTALRRWLERVPDLRLDGERPTPNALAQRMSAFWIAGQSLLYVGRTSKSLAGRVAALYATELGHRRPHAGGHWLKTLRDPSRLRLWWAETDAPEEYEDALLGAFAESLPAASRMRRDGSDIVMPWANVGSPVGPARDTGLSGSLLSLEATPDTPSNVRRSDPSSSIRRRPPSTASTAPRSPRRSAATGAAGGSAGGPSRPQPTHLTEDGLAALRAELGQLRDVERPQVVERIKHARELGDLRENADYEAARNEQSFLEGRVQELERRLRTAVVIRSETRSSASLGSRVRYEVDGSPGELTIVGSTEADPASGRISAASPVGRALLGHRAGDEVIVTTPAAEIRYRILEIG